MTTHDQWMTEALLLSQKARLHAPPNPWVGCVLVKAGKKIGQGFTQPPGSLHAEICALKEAGEKAKGAHLYVTLEPCCHTGRTPPCVNALIEAGIKTVYIGIQDLDPRVNALGIASLQKAGIKVIQGLCSKAIEEELAPYLYQRQTGLPYTILKAAISLDGRIATAEGHSQWITNEEAREDGHRERAHAQAIIIGSQTALNDLPRLDVRHSTLHPLTPPLRVLLDTRGRVPAQGPLFDCSLAPTLVLTSSQVALERVKEWEKAGAEVSFVSTAAERINLQEAWKLLGKRSLLQVLVEGGAVLQSALLERRLVNRLSLYLGPLLLGSSALSFYQTSEQISLSKAQRFSLKGTQFFGDCLRLDYFPV